MFVWGNAKRIAIIVACAFLPASSAQATDKMYEGIGSAASPDLIRAWSIDVEPGGGGAPPGGGTVYDGEPIYLDKCASCHGDFGEGVGKMPPLIRGSGALTDDRPIKTVGSYWPYATTLFDYIKRTMPMQMPQSLTNEETYAVTAFVLYLNGISSESFELTADNITKINMPNRNGFYEDDRQEAEKYYEYCMENCLKYKLVGVAN